MSKLSCRFHCISKCLFCCTPISKSFGSISLFGVFTITSLTTPSLAIDWEQPSINSDSIKYALKACDQIEVSQYVGALRDLWQQESTIRQLVNLCGETAVPELISALQPANEPNPNVRDAVAKTLAYIGSGAATPALINALETEPNSTVRKTIVDALGYLKQPEAISPLISTLRNTAEAPPVREAAAEALGDISAPESVDILIDVLNDTSEEEELRSMSARSLAKIGKPSIPALKPTIQASDLRTRFWGAEALAYIDSPEASRFLEQNAVAVAQIVELADEAGWLNDRATHFRAQSAAGEQLNRKTILCTIPGVAQSLQRCR